MKKIVMILSIIFLLISIFIGCNIVNVNKYNKYTDSFFDTFDIITVVVGYTKNEEEFNSYMRKIHSRFKELHNLYDIYNDYEGINNIKTIFVESLKDVEALWVLNSGKIEAIEGMKK